MKKCSGLLHSTVDRKSNRVAVMLYEEFSGSAQSVRQDHEFEAGNRRGDVEGCEHHK